MGSQAALLFALYLSGETVPVPISPFSKLSLDYKLAYANLLLGFNDTADQKSVTKSAQNKEQLMSNVAIVYWSGTGNTEAMADFVAEGVEAKGGTATIIQAADFGAERVPEFDTFAFGCPAMGDEELEDTEFLPMYDEVEPLMAGEKVGFFGSYDWNNGEWMDYWMQRAEEAGVQPVETVIAKDYPDDEAAEACRHLGELLA